MERTCIPERNGVHTARLSLFLSLVPRLFVLLLFEPLIWDLSVDFIDVALSSLKLPGGSGLPAVLNSLPVKLLSGGREG
jgi:hypothetical protein